MKKYVALLILVAATLSSCSYNTCPTYTKAPSQKTEKEVKV